MSSTVLKQRYIDDDLLLYKVMLIPSFHANFVDYYTLYKYFYYNYENENSVISTNESKMPLIIKSKL